MTNEHEFFLDPSRCIGCQACVQVCGKCDLDKFLCGREVVDFVSSFPAARFEPAKFVALLRKLQPRLYSISSSRRAHPGEVHLTVGVVRYESPPRRGTERMRRTCFA